MKYKLYDTKVIHWDVDGMYNVDLVNDKIQGVISAEIYKVYKGVLPIIVEGQVRIINNEKDIFSCIFHTKAQLIFEPTENPINDLIKMLYEVEEKEKQEWANNIMNTPLDGLYLESIKSDPNTKLNKACEIRDAAKKQNLLS